MARKQLESLETVVVRFAGDSGDGMQITGKEFTNTSAILGNDLATFPDYPAEIRAPAGTLPESFKKLPAEENWKDVKAALPGKKVDAKNAAKVFVSTLPAEMILVTGKPAWQAVPGTKLQWLSNSESDVFRMGDAGAVYFLVSGRWFSAATLAGPWTFASPKLPEDFKEISLEHPRSRVLASVPGTQQAAEGVLLAQVPQTARHLKMT